MAIIYRYRKIRRIHKDPQVRLILLPSMNEARRVGSNDVHLFCIQAFSAACRIVIGQIVPRCGTFVRLAMF